MIWIRNWVFFLVIASLYLAILTSFLIKSNSEQKKYYLLWVYISQFFLYNSQLRVLKSELQNKNAILSYKESLYILFYILKLKIIELFLNSEKKVTIVRKKSELQVYLAINIILLLTWTHNEQYIFLQYLFILVNVI